MVWAIAPQVPAGISAVPRYDSANAMGHDGRSMVLAPHGFHFAPPVGRTVASVAVAKLSVPRGVTAVALQRQRRPSYEAALAVVYLNPIQDAMWDITRRPCLFSGEIVVGV